MLCVFSRIKGSAFSLPVEFNTTCLHFLTLSSHTWPFHMCRSASQLPNVMLSMRVLCSWTKTLPNFLECSVSPPLAASPCAFPKVGHLPVFTRWKTVGSLKAAPSSGFRRSRQTPGAFEDVASRMTFFLFPLKNIYSKHPRLTRSPSPPCPSSAPMPNSESLRAPTAPITVGQEAATPRGRGGQAV